MYLINEFLEYCDEHDISFYKDGDYDLCVAMIDNWQNGMNLLIFCEKGESIGRLVPATWREPEILYNTYLTEEFGGPVISCYDEDRTIFDSADVCYPTLKNAPDHVEECQRPDTVPMPLEAFKKW